MRLKRLELLGFKSFFDRTILTFDSSITGVVGPNGCGKSNIVDAILWVMGEQSPKHLRGNSMTDVIFNGSDTRSASSMAEVSLVLDKQGVALAPQFAAFEKNEEISITRRIYRDGNGEFLINKVQCRLRDIHELFMDTGVGRRAYSVIEQGQIDRMINVKPEDRRGLFEEVAGITKYKAKRKEAERKIEATHQNLLRVQDIVNELEKQIRSLKTQATRARKYREIKSELETVDLYLLGRQLHKIQTQLDEAKARRETLMTERAELDAQVASLESETTQLEVLRIDQEKVFEAKMARERELSLAVQKSENQQSLVEERTRHLTQSLEENASEQAILEAKRESLEKNRNQEGDEFTKLQTEMSSCQTQLTELEALVEEAQAAQGERENTKEKFSTELQSLTKTVVGLENQIFHGEAREKELVAVQESLNSRLADLVVLIDEQKKRMTEIEALVVECTQKCAQVQEQTAASHSECQQLSQDLTALEDTLFKSREEYHAQKSRLESLRELQQNLEGYSPTAREILLKMEGTETSALPLAEVLQPTPELEEALELLLGADMNTLIVKTTSEAEAIARKVQETGLERVRVVATDELAQDSSQLTAPPREEATPLLEKIHITPGYETIARWKLSGAFVASTTEKVLELRRRYPGLTFLPLDSRIHAHADKSLGTGILPSRTGVFARRREIQELESTCQNLDTTLADVTQKRQALFESLQSQETKHAELKDRLSSLHVESVEARKEKEKTQLEMSRSDRDYLSLTDESERNVAQIQSCRSAVAEHRKALENANTEKSVLSEKLAEISVTIERAEEEQSNYASRLSGARVEFSRLEERRLAIEARRQKLEEDIHDVLRRHQSLSEQASQQSKEIHELQEELGQLKVAHQEAEEKRNQALVEISDAKQAFHETSHKLQEHRERCSGLQKKREETVSEIQQLELKAAHEESEQERVKGLSQERYQQDAKSLDDTVQLTSEQLPLLVEKLETGWDTFSPGDKQALLDDHLKTLREKVTRYGEVNLTAIHEFEEVEKRHVFLAEQKLDLEKSIQILHDAIKKIDDSTHKRFQETFEGVNAKFKEIFPILFNGGKAELSLTNPENILEGGVDILAQPPGKKLQSITLLSGGEKALTAVSLVLAIFARKPSPFCLLDEVDAPLDDANVSRFNTVVRKMAEKTQFIVITHNKKTMEIAESLYGVTMERAGVSRMASVQLN